MANLQTQNEIQVPTIRNNGLWSFMANTGDPDLDLKLANNRSHAADAIKNLNDFNIVSNWILENGSYTKYMDNAMFVMGCNFGLRCSDLTNLKFGQIVDDNGEFYMGIRVIEKKTSNLSRPKPPRAIPINKRAQNAFALYAGSLDWNFNPNDYLFPNAKKDGPMTYDGVYKKFMRLIDERHGKIKLASPIHGSTHFMRKTFAYHYILSEGGVERNRRIESLQKAFGHSSATITLMYAGITSDEIYDTVITMDIGNEIAPSEIIIGDSTPITHGPDLTTIPDREDRRWSK